METAVAVGSAVGNEASWVAVGGLGVAVLGGRVGSGGGLGVAEGKSVAVGGSGVGAGVSRTGKTTVGTLVGTAVAGPQLIKSKGIMIKAKRIIVRWRKQLPGINIRGKRPDMMNKFALFSN